QREVRVFGIRRDVDLHFYEAGDSEIFLQRGSRVDKDVVAHFERRLVECAHGFDRAHAAGTAAQRLHWSQWVVDERVRRGLLWPLDAQRAIAIESVGAT